MAKKMLIDTGHPEETRVVVVSGNRIEEFDFESAARKQLKGNIYLAKVTRVEPSLQAAFVEYGGNRHGFLAFSEIHPDYYQIPVADRERLLRQEAEESRRLEEEANEAEESETGRGRRGLRRNAKRNGRRKRSGAGERKARESTGLDLSDPLAFAELHLAAVGEAPSPDQEAETEASARAQPAETDTSGGRGGAGETLPSEPDTDAQREGGPEGEALLRTRSHWILNDENMSAGEDQDVAGIDTSAREDEGENTGETPAPGNREDGADADGSDAAADADADDAETTTFNELSADEEAREELERRPRVRLRDYKIQEVIKRRQIMLVQVVKEERGNKGAALTTYLSLAGRYCVLMPNTPRGGGISRKITNAADRKRLKAIAAEFDVPEGMGLIIRTAGANRTKAEIRRDYEYLLRLWESVRELTLKSSAPCLVYEEGSLIKRSIRDLYSREIDTVQVEGEDGYKEAKAFMRMLMPSHAKNVQSYKDRIPLFQRYQVEQQLDAMLNPQVQLPSGGYIVLNPTEALVAIDVNSGKSTREHNIENTALRTNLEAAEEIARQLRLRDLAGLIVIDFIDMEESRNNRAVERKLKECLKQDRARIQTGRISMFGLLEMSRQRLRPGMMEISTVPCDHCQGAGIVRSVESAALRILRACEEEGLRKRSQDLSVPCAPDVANYLLNFKRHQLMDIEQRYGACIFVEPDATAARDSFELKRGTPMSEERRQALNAQAVRLESAFGQEGEESGPETGETAPAPAPAAAAAAEEKPKARRGRKRRKEEAEEAQAEASAEAQEAEEPSRDGKGKAAETGDGAETKRRRRRGKRGGRRHRKQRPEISPAEAAAAETSAGEETGGTVPAAEDAASQSPAAEGAWEGLFAPEALAAPVDEGHHEPPAKDVGAPAPEAAGPAGKRTNSTGEGEDKAPAAAAGAGPSSSETEPAAGDRPAAEDLPEIEIPTPAREQPQPDEAGAAKSAPATEKPANRAGRAARSNGRGRKSDDGGAREEVPSEPAAETGSGAPETAGLGKGKRPVKRGWWQRRSM